jgi:hypothetical protein
VVLLADGIGAIAFAAAKSWQVSLFPDQACPRRGTNQQPIAPGKRLNLPRVNWRAL